MNGMPRWQGRVALVTLILLLICDAGGEAGELPAELLAQLKHKDPDQRLRAVLLLNHYDDERAVRPLLSALARKCGDVCHATATSSSWGAERSSSSRERSWRVNFHAKGWAMAS